MIFSGNEIRAFLISIARFVFKIISHVLIKFRLLDELVIVHFDGGLCAQMHFYLVGMLFEEKGYNVKFDPRFFEKWGVDLNGKYVRNFDLIKVFPYLSCQMASRWELFWYKGFLYVNDYNDLHNPLLYASKKPPVFLCGFYRDPQNIYNEIFQKYFKVDYSILNEKSKQVLCLIQSKTVSIAIHIRRGDLASFHWAYGEPVSEKYFNNAIDFIESREKVDVDYFIFSDDIKWVNDCLISNLHLNNNYHIVDCNGSDKGYMDLLLISACQHQITSKGSLGKYGALLNLKENKVITIYDDRYERAIWDNRHKDIVFIKA